MNEPKVSIVLPCLNSKEYIRECIESIIKQTLKAIEIIVVDAGSTDGTLEIIQEYAKKDSRIRLINSEKKSYGYQVNVGLNTAKGKYFAIVESDDYILPNMYKKLTAIADKHKVEVLKADYKIFKGDFNNRKFEYKEILPYPELYNKVLDPDLEFKVFENFVVSWSGIYRTDFLKNNKIYHNESPGASFQDNGFWFQVFTKAHRVMFYDRAFYLLRRDNPNSSIYQVSKFYCFKGEYDFIRNYLAQNPELEKKYAPLVAMRRFRSYIGRLKNQVPQEEKLNFLKMIAEDFKKISEAKEIDVDLYTKPNMFELDMILKDYNEYYKVFLSGDTSEKTILTLENYKLVKKLTKAKAELEFIKNSPAFKIGSSITWLPNKIQNWITYYKKCGIRHTIKKFLRNMKNKFKELS